MLSSFRFEIVMTQHALGRVWLSCLIGLLFFACPTKQSIHPINRPNFESNTMLVSLIYGDSGTGTSEQIQIAASMRNACRQHRCQLGFMLGDNFYENGVQAINDMLFSERFEKPYSPLNIPIYPILGNHDYRGDIHAQMSYQSNAWQMPGRYYLVPNLAPFVRVFALDTNEASLESQTKELEKHLCDFEGWKIVLGHHPVVNDGLSHGDNRGIFDQLSESFHRCKIHFYLSGHEHFLEVLRGSSFTQIISGAASKLYDPPGTCTPKSRSFASDFKQSSCFPSYGFMIAEISISTLTLFIYNQNAELLGSETFHR